MRKSIKTTLGLLLAATAISVGTTQAFDMIITAREGAGAESSTLQNTSEYTFENLTAGTHTSVDWTGVGTFDTLNVLNADKYGGACGVGHYAVEGVGGNTSTTLTLDHSSQYFGMWWSAGDPKNVLNFYSGGTLLGSFTTANLLTCFLMLTKETPIRIFLIRTQMKSTVSSISLGMLIRVGTRLFLQIMAVLDSKVTTTRRA